MGSKSIGKSFRKPLRAALLAGITALAITAVSGVAQADASYTLNYANSGSGLGAGPFGTITLTDGTGTNGIASGSVQVSETLSPNSFAFTGSADNLEFNLSPKPGSLSISNLSFTGSSGTATAYTLTANPSVPHGSGAGSFDWGIDCTACGTGASHNYNTLVFDIAGVSSSSFAKNSAGISFVSDIYDSSNGKTGYVWATDPNTPPSVPEPGSLALLGTGLLGLGFALRRRRRS